LLLIYINFPFRTLKEELQVAENKKQEAVITYNAICEKLSRINSELYNLNVSYFKLRSMRSEFIRLIDELKDELESIEVTFADVFVSI